MRRTFLSICLILASIAASAQMKSVVYFDASSGYLDLFAKKTLDTLVPVLKKAGKYKLYINGYCDCTGTHPADTALANDRARSVFDYLSEKGIPDDKMTVTGHAETTPASSGEDPIGKFKNRRTEIIIAFPSIHHVTSGYIASIDSLKAGQKLVLKNLSFVNDSATILPESMPALEQLLAYMENNPTLEIKLSGYVCCTPDQALSVARAKFVYDYLVKNNINPYRMTYDGFSNKVPIMPNDNTDPIAAKVNRRVEVTIIRK